MDMLWAPWRVKYLMDLKKKSKGCIFCQIAHRKKDRQNYIFKRTVHAFAVLNIYPYNNGHSLIIPYRHVNDLSKLDREEKLDVLSLVESTKTLLDKTLRPKGYNIGLNLGRIAGAGYPGHVHIHIVPRWGGDVNFMPIIARTKVISESLDALYLRLVKAHRSFRCAMFRRVQR